MNIIFNNVTMHNFMSFKDTTLDLSKTGFISINGINNNPVDESSSNGSGKSAIWESILWCLTGDTIRGTKDIVNNDATDGCYVTLDFILDESYYTITRSKNHSVYKTDLKIYINGEDKSGKGIRDSEKLLKEYLPDLDSQMIGSVIILGQGLPQRFTNNTPSGRKEILEKLSKSDFMIEDLKSKVSARKEILDVECSKCLLDKSVKESNVSLLTMQKTEYENKLKEYDFNNDIENKIKTLEIGIEEDTQKSAQLLEEMSATSCDKNVLEVQLDEIKKVSQQELSLVESTYKSDINELNMQFVSNDTKIRMLNSEIIKANNIKDVCPTCKQKIIGFVVPDVSLQKSEVVSLKEECENIQKEINNLESKMTVALDECRQKYASDILEMNDKVSSYKDTLDRLNNTYHSTLSSLSVKKNELKSLQEHLKENKQSLVDQIESINKSIESLTTEISEIDAKYTDLKIHLEVVSKFTTYLSRDFRGYLLSDIVEYINQRAKFYSEYIFGTTLIDFFVEGNCINIMYNKKPYESLSGGEKQKVDLIIQFSLRDMLSNYMNFSSNILVLDEIFDNLDNHGCQRVINMINNRLNVPSIYIVSHHLEELDIPFDSKLSVIKDEYGVSNILG